MNLLRFYLNKLAGKPSVFDFDLLGQSVTLGIAAPREIRRAREIAIESELVERIQATLQQRGGGTLFDIGANIGLISILLSKSEKGRASQIFAMEPEPRNFRQLKNNLALNHLLETVHPYQLALGASDGEVQLHIRGSEGEGRHSIAATEGSTDSITVEMATMATFCERIGQVPDMLKIDVEGAEGQVLAGMDALMAGTPPADIFLEVHAKGDGDRMPGGERIGEWLQQRGYELAWSNVRRSGEHRHYHRP